MIGRDMYVDEFESEIEVSHDSESNFSDERDTKTIDSVVPDELSDNSVSLEPLYADFDAESLQKKHKKNCSFTKSINASSVEYT